MKILCLSDTHGYLPELDLAGIDLVLHAGDITFEHKTAYFKQALFFHNQFIPWVNRILDYCPFYFTWGNHEIFAELYAYNELNSCSHLLFDRAVTVNGYKIYGTPWQPQFFAWAFNVDDTPEGLGRKYSFIPNDIDILLTHCPERGYLDTTAWDNKHLGSLELSVRMGDFKQCKLHVFGHIHHSYGTIRDNKYTSVNACICDEDYNPTNKPIIVEV